MNLIDIARNVQEFVPSLSLVLIKQRINIRYQQILRIRAWEFLKEEVLFTTASSYTTGTVSITSGSTAVTGSGTTFTSGMVGRTIYVGEDGQGYIISAFTDATHITLADSYISATVSGETYAIKALRYGTSSTDINRIRSIVFSDRPLKEKTLAYFNSIDPDRSSTGEPQFYATTSKSRQAGSVIFELYPVPDAAYVVQVNYMKKADDLTTDSDVSLIEPEIIEAGVLWDCYRMEARKNPAFIGLARDAMQEYRGLVDELIHQDLSDASLPDKVRNTFAPTRIYSSEYAVDHDVEGW